MEARSGWRDRNLVIQFLPCFRSHSGTPWHLMKSNAISFRYCWQGGKPQTSSLLIQALIAFSSIRVSFCWSACDCFRFFPPLNLSLRVLSATLWVSAASDSERHFPEERSFFASLILLSKSSSCLLLALLLVGPCGILFGWELRVWGSRMGNENINYYNERSCFTLLIAHGYLGIYGYMVKYVIEEELELEEESQLTETSEIIHALPIVSGSS